MSARRCALDALIACRKNGAWSNGVLKIAISKALLDSRDAALASQLCYGVLQNRNFLDFHLKQLLTGKLKDLHPVIRDILHMGLYQIYLLDKIPDSAAVNESVELAKKYCAKQRFAPGLVNGVLRSAVRTKGTLKAPQALADRYSHPQVLIDLLKDSVGEDRLEGMLKANNAAPETVIQVNTLRLSAKELLEELTREGVAATVHPWMQDCLVLKHTGNLEKLSAFQNGLFYVQDPAAKLSISCIPFPENARVLDCCAAPGGKSFAAGIALQGKGSIISCDVHEHKLELIQRGAQRLGLSQITARLQDATLGVDAWEQQMDVVIADVPCSGYGIIRKKPDIREKDPREMEQLPQLQLEILRRQATYVKPGGVLLYSTCTLLKRENEDVVQRFLKENDAFHPEKLQLPASFPENATGMLTLVPGEYDTDGFFICLLRRRS